MISSVGKLIRSTTKRQVYTFDISHLKGGFNTTAHFIVHKQNQHVKYITNRICAHNGCKLIPKNDAAAHNWGLNLGTLEYSDCFSSKQTLDFTGNGNCITIKQPVYTTNKHLQSGKQAFICIIKNRLPWKGMPIRFQCRFKRTPDIYDAEFWHYFTEVYIGEEHFKYDSYCAEACTKLNKKNIL